MTDDDHTRVYRLGDLPVGTVFRLAGLDRAGFESAMFRVRDRHSRYVVVAPLVRWGNLCDVGRIDDWFPTLACTAVIVVNDHHARRQRAREAMLIPVAVGLSTSFTSVSAYDERLGRYRCIYMDAGTLMDQQAASVKRRIAAHRVRKGYWT